jgi:hypothetical protein
MQWCKYDAPFDRCEHCGATLTCINCSTKAIETGAYDFEHCDAWDNTKVQVFGVWSTSTEVDRLSEQLRKEYNSREKTVKAQAA